MVATGGSIVTLSIDSRLFSATVDSDMSRKLGGYENSIELNGDETARLIKLRAPWKISGVVVSCDDTKGDHEWLKDAADGSRFFPITIEYPNGIVYQATGQITGEVPMLNQSATATLELSGPGTLTQQ